MLWPLHLKVTPADAGRGAQVSSLAEQIQQVTGRTATFAPNKYRRISVFSGRSVVWLCWNDLKVISFQHEQHCFQGVSTSCL
jgi:hypothetical protein